jgi:hypothetical protein
MFKGILAAAALIMCAQAGASTENIAATQITSKVLQSIRTLGLNWNVGDACDYNLNGGIISGTMHMFVREANDQGFWLQEDLDLGALGGKHKVETLIDKNTGKVLEMIMDGNKQTPPDPANQEVVDSHKDSVTVPKGTFDCMWAKIHDKKENTDSQVWINPTAVPIAGMLKTVAPTQIGEVTIELTDFVRK